MSKSTPFRYPVALTAAQRQDLEEVTSTGRQAARKIRRAQVLLLSDQNRPGGPRSRTEVAQLLGMHPNTVDRVRKRFHQEGHSQALARKLRPYPPVPRKIDGRAEAHLVAICCSPAPEGRTRWTLQLLAQEMGKRRIVTQVCAETVRQTLKKMICSPGAKSAGASPSATRSALWRRWKKSSMFTPSRPIPRSR